MKRFYRVPMAKNIHYLNLEKGEVDGISTWNPDRPRELIEYLNSLTHCHLFIDEAWRVVDSYQGVNFTVGGRDLVLVTRHKFRTVNLISQRPTNIHVTARANMNRFYKFKKLATWPWIRFARYEFQEMDKESVNEEVEPISVKTYWGSSKIFNAYNSWQFGQLQAKHALHMRAFDLSLMDKLTAFYRKLFVKKEQKIIEKHVVDEPF